MPQMVRAVGLPPGSFPGRCCFDPVRRTTRTPGGRFLSATASATATSPDCAPADSPAAPTTTASATTPMPADGPGSRSRPGEPTHLSCDLRTHSSCCNDGDLDVSRRTLAPGLGGPTQHPAFTWQQR